MRYVAVLKSGEKLVFHADSIRANPRRDELVFTQSGSGAVHTVPITQLRVLLTGDPDEDAVRQVTASLLGGNGG